MWLSLYRGPADTANAAIRDYQAMLQPTAIYKSIKNRDFAVGATTAVSILLTVVVVFSTGLITLSPIDVTNTVPVTLSNRLQALSAPDNLFSPMNYTTDMSSIVFGLFRTNFTYPFGLTQDVAYQTALANVSNNAVVAAEVDGFKASLVCQPATLNTTVFDFSDSDEEIYASRVNFTLEAPGCNISASLGGLYAAISILDEGYFASAFSNPCGGSLDVDNMRMGFIFGFAKQTAEPGIVSITESAQVICKPSYAIARYKLVQTDNRLLSLTLIPGAPPKILANVHPWTLSSLYFMSTGIGKSWVGKDVDGTSNLDLAHSNWHDYNETWLLDDFWRTSLGIVTDIPQNISSMLDVETLAATFREPYQRYMAAAAHYALPSSATVLSLSGTALERQNRLLVQPLPAHLIAALLGVCGLLVSVAWVVLPTPRSLARNPCSIIGPAALLSDLRPQHSPVGADKTHHPLVLHLLSRLGMCVAVIATIVGLVAALKESQAHNGVGLARNDSWVRHVWTVGPAAVLSMFRIYYAAADFQSRALAPYLSLSKKGGANFEKSLSIDLLNRYQIPAVYKAGRLRLWSVLTTGLVAILAASLPILSASLFNSATFLQEVSTQLEILTAFDVNSSQNNTYQSPSVFASLPENLAMRLANLILQDNLSYPAFTYRDLAFPSFQLVETSSLTPSSSKGTNYTIIIRTVIPALQSRLMCRLYDRSLIRASYNTNIASPSDDAEHNAINPLRINITGEDCYVPSWPSWSSNYTSPPSSSDTPSNMVISTTTEAEDGSLLPLDDGEYVFGQGGPAEREYSPWHVQTRPGQVLGCSSRIYAWGQFSPTNLHEPLPSISAIGCNISLDMIDMQVQFILNNDNGHQQLVLDPSFAPIKNESSRRTSSDTSARQGFTRYAADDRVFSHFPPSEPTQLLSNFFQVLTTSPYGVPASMLASTSGTAAADDAQRVMEAIQLQHGIVMAQYHSQVHRVPVSGSADLAALDWSMVVAGMSAGTTKFPAVAIDSATTAGSGQTRVVQDAASTYALVAVLAVILILGGIAWVMMGKTAVLPGSPTSAAGLYSLMSFPGGLLEMMPSNAETLSDDDLRKVMGGDDARFCLGWQQVKGPRDSGNEKREVGYMIYSERQLSLDDLVMTGHAASVDEVLGAGPKVASSVTSLRRWSV
ncbi:hypothetical protein B0H63DRAFT_518135 [Podospora didyma]|uniref:Uncharacterized protein n=1 Tax=Podospora didyma TaxID=330526 RepID=A0AAE0U924_9PEZI|nr:hypothetical protein B0H63DRAFT_518135 [Podospora didyma]